MWCRPIWMSIWWLYFKKFGKWMSNKWSLMYFHLLFSFFAEIYTLVSTLRSQAVCNRLFIPYTWCGIDDRVLISILTFLGINTTQNLHEIPWYQLQVTSIPPIGGGDTDTNCSISFQPLSAYTQYGDIGTPSFFWYQCPINFAQILISMAYVHAVDRGCAKIFRQQWSSGRMIWWFNLDSGIES